MLFKRRYFPPKKRPPLRWQLLGWVIVFASIALGAYVKTLWVRYTDSQIIPGKMLYNTFEMKKEADRLNDQLGP